MRTCLFLGLALLFCALDAAAMEIVVGPTELDPALLAEELELPGTEEAAVLVIAGLGLDRLSLGFEPVALSALPGMERHPPLLLRGLSEGLVNLSVERDGVAWDGQLRLFGGRITRLDVDAVLRSAKARGEGAVATGPSFDLFGFYDELDARTDWQRKGAWCDEALDGLDEASADARLVRQACDKMAADQAREEAASRVGLQGADELGEALSESGVREAAVPVGLVYRRDGRPRLSAPGTGIRWGIVGATVLGGALATYGALYWETQAQQEYLAYRDAERVGDQLALSEHLFYTRQFDRNRDGFATGAGLFFTGAATAAVFQAIEAARFRKARRRVLGEPQ